MTRLVIFYLFYSLDSFKTPSIASINNLLLSVKSVCMLDPIPLILLNKLLLLSPLYKQIIPLPISGKVPAHMKNAHVTPILKKNNPHDSTVQFPIYHIYPKLLKELYLSISTTIHTTNSKVPIRLTRVETALCSSSSSVSELQALHYWFTSYLSRTYYYYYYYYYIKDLIYIIKYINIVICGYNKTTVYN